MSRVVIYTYSIKRGLPCNHYLITTAIRHHRLVGGACGGGADLVGVAAKRREAVSPQRETGCREGGGERGGGWSTGVRGGPCNETHCLPWPI